MLICLSVTLITFFITSTIIEQKFSLRNKFFLCLVFINFYGLTSQVLLVFIFNNFFQDFKKILHHFTISKISTFFFCFKILNCFYAKKFSLTQITILNRQPINCDWIKNQWETGAHGKNKNNNDIPKKESKVSNNLIKKFFGEYKSDRKKN